jgi:3D (Asp-Asp-Asp) domain-containing protein
MKTRSAAVAVIALAGCTHGHHHEASAAPAAVRRVSVAPRPVEAEASRSAPLPTSPPSQGEGAPHMVESSPAQGAPSASVRVSSTAFCQIGTMADGHHVHAGAAAGNRWPLGTHLRIVETGETVVIEDRIGWGSDLDIWMPSCAEAIAYGRREIEVKAA